MPPRPAPAPPGQTGPTAALAEHPQPARLAECQTDPGPLIAPATRREWGMGTGQGPAR